MSVACVSVYPISVCLSVTVPKNFQVAVIKLF